MYYGAEIANRQYSYQRIANLTTTSQEAIGTSNKTDTSVPLTGRKYLHIWNQAGKAVFWSLDSTLAGSTVVSKASGAIADGQEVVLPFGPALRVYICTQTGQANITVTELS
jgi:hypothetical protein